jgi:hypothetical protein
MLGMLVEVEALSVHGGLFVQFAMHKSSLRDREPLLIDPRVPCLDDSPDRCGSSAQHPRSSRSERLVVHLGWMGKGRGDRETMVCESWMLQEGLVVRSDCRSTSQQSQRGRWGKGLE